MTKNTGAAFVPSEANRLPVRDYGIDYGRIMTTKERGRVRTRFRTWSYEHGFGMIEPNLIELRWSDDYTTLYVNRESGLLPYFASLYPEHHAVAEDQHWAIYNRLNPAADALLSAIEEVTERGA